MKDILEIIFAGISALFPIYIYFSEKHNKQKPITKKKKKQNKKVITDAPSL